LVERVYSLIEALQDLLQKELVFGLVGKPSYMGVNLGLLPTKGLTLPLVSYGGSALLLNIMAIAVL
jgi:cell division protein FtsW (lipid II flippase)